MEPKFINQLWQDHRGKIIGAVSGFLLGILIILFGFFQTLFVTACMVIGYVIGKRIDEKEDIVEILDKLLPPGYR